MKATELRIGNLVLSKDMPVEIEEITIEKVTYYFGTFTLDFIKPIPLDKEWLIRFGFECRVVYGNKHWLNNRILIFEDKKGKFVFAWGLKIKSVHQLQNLYFALTGKELKL